MPGVSGVVRQYVVTQVPLRAVQSILVTSVKEAQQCKGARAGGRERRLD